MSTCLTIGGVEVEDSNTPRTPRSFKAFRNLKSETKPSKDTVKVSKDKVKNSRDNWTIEQWDTYFKSRK